MATKITTIKIAKETKSRIDKLRVYPKESYDSIIQSMLEILNICRVNPLSARKKLLILDRRKRFFHDKLP